MTQDTENKICKCGNQMVKISGFRKVDGKPYSGWKCNQCNAYESIRQQGSYQGNYQSRPQSPKPDWEEIRAEKAEGQAKGAAFNKSVDIVIAMYQKDEIKSMDIVPMIKKVFAELKEINLENGK